MYCYMCGSHLRRRYARITPYAIPEKYKFHYDKELFDIVYNTNAKDYICWFCFNTYTYYVNRFCSNTGNSKRVCECFICNKIKEHMRKKIILYFIALNDIENNIKRKIIEEHLRVDKKFTNLIFN